MQPPTGVAGTDIDSALSDWEAYLELTKKMLVPADYQTISGKQFKKKSAARKYARAFLISDSVLDKEIIRDKDNNVLEATFLVKAWLPDGRTTTGIGNCSHTERGFNKQNHDIPATAHTRAKNRAIFDLVGSGEVSAEEMYGDDEAIQEAKQGGKRKGARPGSKPKEEPKEKPKTRPVKEPTTSKKETVTPEKVSGDFSTDWEAEAKKDRSVDFVVDVVKTGHYPMNNKSVIKAADMLLKHEEITKDEHNRILKLAGTPAK